MTLSDLQSHSPTAFTIVCAWFLLILCIYIALLFWRNKVLIEFVHSNL